MTQIYKVAGQLSWWLGLLSIVMTILVKLLNLTPKLHVQPHTFLLAASAFFLCALASRSLERA